MKKTLFVGALMVLVLSACNTSATPVPEAIKTPVSLPTQTPIPPHSTLAVSRTSAPITEQPDSFEYPSVAKALADLKA